MRMLAIIILAVVVAGPVLWAADESPATQQDLAKENAALRQEIARLRERLAKLEARVGKMPPPTTAPYSYRFKLPEIPRIAPRAIPIPPPTAPMPFKAPRIDPFGRIPSVPMPAPVPDSVPEDWQKREFNGQPLYVIPLN